MQILALTVWVVESTSRHRIDQPLSKKRDATFSSIFGYKLFQKELCFIYDIDDQELLSFRYNVFTDSRTCIRNLIN